MCRQNYDDAPRPTHKLAAIDEITKLVAALRDRLSKLDDFTADQLWRPDAEVSRLLDSTDATESRYGHTIYRQRIDEKHEITFALQEPHIHEALTVLEGYCEEAHEMIRKDEGGRTSGEALRMWLINIRNMWVDVLDRPFTRDYHNGSLISTAGRFCVDALRAVDPTVSEPQLSWAMRKVIESTRR